MISFGDWQIDFSHPLVNLLAVLLLVSLALSLRSVFKRLFRRTPPRAALITILNVVAYGTVILILLEPRFYQQVNKSVVLVTQGATFSDDGTANSSSLYVAPGMDTSEESLDFLSGADWLLEINQLALREPALSAVEVWGFGLEEDQWQNFPERVQVSFNPPALFGFIEMQWQRSLVEGDALHITGRYHIPGNESIAQIRLLDPASNIVNEQRIKSGENFNLSTRIKTRGQLEYRLEAWNGGKLISEQLVPFESRSDTRLNIMIEQSNPSFEARALKSHAASNGHRIRLNSTISKERAITQSVNLVSDADMTFSPQVLAEQDILIIDGRALTDLSPARMQWLLDAVEQGLGLLILADSTLLENASELRQNLLDGFSIAPFSGDPGPVVPRLMNSTQNDWQSPVPAVAIELNASYQDVLITTEDERTLAVKHAKGLGQIAISLIRHSHNWLTAGYRAQWSDYWSVLITAIARQRGDGFLLPQPGMEFARVKQRVSICAFNAEPQSGIVISAVNAQGQPTKSSLLLTADNLNSPRQCAYFWPEVGGWHQIQLHSAGDGPILDQKAIYIFQADQWLAQNRQQRVQASWKRSISSNDMLPEKIETRVSEPLDIFWLWLSLVLSSTILWLERRLDSGIEQ